MQAPSSSSGVEPARAAAPAASVVPSWRKWFLVALFGFLCVTLSVTILWALVEDGGPFQPELLVPWVIVSLVDLYAAFIMFYCFVWYKESGWLARVFWAFAIATTGSVAIAAYLVLQLVALAPGRPAWHILMREQSGKPRETAAEDRP